jgi:hypothetical protein
MYGLRETIQPLRACSYTRLLVPLRCMQGYYYSIFSGNVFKLSGLFMRLRWSRIFIGINIDYRYATAMRSNVVNLMTLAFGI